MENKESHWLKKNKIVFVFYVSVVGATTSYTNIVRTNIDLIDKIRARIELLLPNPLQYALACLLVGNKRG